MAVQNLGRVGIVLKGAWSGLTDYVALDLVSYDGNSWVAKRPNKNVEPTTEHSDDWQLISNNADLVSTVQGYKNDAADSASAAAASATSAASSASKGTEAQAMIAPTEASTTASMAHPAGSYFILSGVLYQATADIASGGTITPNTNCKAVTVGGQLGELKSALESVAIIPVNMAYVTDGVSDTKYGVTYAKGNKENELILYGTASQNGFLSIYNGSNYATSTGSDSPTKRIPKGTYTVYFSSGNFGLLYYSESKYTNRTALVNGQTLTVGDNGCAIFLRIVSGNNYGTSESPLTVTLSVYEGESMPSEPTAIDNVARDGKIDKNQGVGNAGKFLKVGTDGVVTPVVLPTDTTLQQSGIPADAKATGDKISELKSELKSDLESVAYIADNIAYVTDGVSASHYGVTYAKGTGKNELNTYGTATQNGFLNVFNGQNGYTTSGSTTPSKNIPKGTYTVYISPANTESICFTTGTFSDRVALTNGQTLVVPDGGGAVFMRIFSSSNYGTQENPRRFELTLIEGVDKPKVSTAIDKIARDGKVDNDQGVGNAGKFLKVGSDGIVTPVILPTDATLQQSGVPADAKTVGENLLLSMDSGSIVFAIGGFNAIGTINDTLTTQVRTKSPVKVGEYGGIIACEEGYEIRVFNYSAAAFTDSNLISKSNYTSNPVELIPNTYVGFSIRNSTPTVQTDVSNSEHLIINIPEQTVAQAVKKLINGDISSYNHGPFDLYTERFSEWYSGLQSDYTGFVRTSKYADVITAFDALMALDTAYITKNSLGTASGTDSQGNSYTIYEYVFKPKNYSSTINTRKVPKIYMDGSIHGFEKCSTYGLYYFLKDLVTNWDKNQSLAAIRQSVEIHVIPVSNPYGFDNFQYKNGNDVNINRNFNHNGDWVVIPDGSDQNGLAAFDQPESAIIRDWLLADENNILCYLNLHTNGQWNVSSYNEMNANMPSSDRFDEYYNRIFRVATNHIEEQTIRWPSMYENIQPGSSAFCGKIQASVTESSTKGTASAWANTMRRIVAMTFEGFNGISINGTQIVDAFSTQAQKMNSENIGNIVVQMLREYSD